MLLTAADGVEFTDWGGAGHVGGGSHGSLAAGDSHAPLIWCGLATGEPRARAVVDRGRRAAVAAHFGLA